MFPPVAGQRAGHERQAFVNVEGEAYIPGTAGPLVETRGATGKSKKGEKGAKYVLTRRESIEYCIMLSNLPFPERI